ncbi:unnamed protein product [Absidia cylindrospora]
MNDWVETHPTHEQVARQEQQGDDGAEHGPESDPASVSPPEWLMPDRYRVQTDTKFRLKMMNHLYQHHGWYWFEYHSHIHLASYTQPLLATLTRLFAIKKPPMRLITSQARIYLTCSFVSLGGFMLR